MGCFLRCFGSSKDGNRRKHRHKVQPRDQRTASKNPAQSTVSLVQDSPEKPITPVAEINYKPDEQLSSSTRKKVTFDTNVKTYEHVFPNESIDFSPENEENSKNEENLAKSSQSQSSCESSSATSSSGSYPPNHRYQNCRESDDEEDELEYEEGDLDDDYDGLLDDDDDDDGFNEDVDDRIRGVTEEIADRSTVMGGLPEEEEEEEEGLNGVKSMGFNRSARDRSGYVHSVLNPVENLTQWKAVKAKGTIHSLKPQKENFSLDQEHRDSFSSEPSFKELSFSFKSKSDHQQKKSSQEMAVDASLSNWLSSSETTPISKSRTNGSDAITPEKSTSHVSNSPRSQEERPILGALTLEEIKQFSASSSSPRRSPCRSPDEMPIIGTVGTYWNNIGAAKDSGSVSSFKGIPNTTSKYREDKRVNWHSTPFETRLERALNRNAAAEAYSTHAPNVC